MVHGGYRDVMRAEKGKIHPLIKLQFKIHILLLVLMYFKQDFIAFRYCCRVVLSVTVRALCGPGCSTTSHLAFPIMTVVRINETGPRRSGDHWHQLKILCSVITYVVLKLLLNCFFYIVLYEF